VAGIVWQWRLAENNSSRLQIALAESELITEIIKGGEAKTTIFTEAGSGSIYTIRGGGDLTVVLPSGTAGFTGGRKELAKRPDPKGAHAITSTHLSFDKKWIAEAHADGTTSIIEVRTGQTITPTLHHRLPINAVRFPPDDRLVATGSSDSTIRIWAWRTGRLITELFQSEDSAIYGLRFTEDGRHLVSVNTSNMLTVWNTKTWQLRSSHSVEITPLNIYIGQGPRTNTEKIHPLIKNHIQP
jgi:WD40 repeat protein